MDTLIVIPARFGSSRLPGKPLALIAGETLLGRTFKMAQAAASETGAQVVVATDDARIETHAKELGADVVMTDPALASGSDRALAASQALGATPALIVNLQGDAPFTPPAYIRALIQAARAHKADVWTPVVRLTWAALDKLRAEKQETPFSGTTCVRAPNGQALWFSKNILPAIRKEKNLRAQGDTSPVFQHIGLYAYSFNALQRFSTLPQSEYEQLEGLEQLRFLENGMRIYAAEVLPTPFLRAGIDTQTDIIRAEALIEAHGDPASTLVS